MGNMSREVAMEQYIARLSDTVPGWMDASSAGDDKLESSEGGVHGIIDPNQGSLPHDQINSTNERKSELKSGAMGTDFIEGSTSLKTMKNDNIGFATISLPPQGRSPLSLLQNKG